MYLAENTSQAAKSSAVALCGAQPPKAALSAELCELAAAGGQGVRAASCKSLVKKANGLFDSLISP